MRKKRADLELCQDLGSSILNDASLFLFFFLLIPGFFFLKHNGACIDLTVSFTYTVKLEHILNYAVHYIKPGLSSPPRVSSKVLFDLCIKTTFTRWLIFAALLGGRMRQISLLNTYNLLFCQLNITLGCGLEEQFLNSINNCFLGTACCWSIKRGYSWFSLG